MPDRTTEDEGQALQVLIETAYDATVDPLAADDLFDLWGAQLEMLGDRIFITGEDSTPGLVETERHFRRALQIFERMGREQRSDEALRAMVDDHVSAAFVLDGRGRVLAANGEAARALGARSGALLDRLAIGAEAQRTLGECLRETATARDGTGRHAAGTVRALEPDGADGNRILLATRFTRPDSHGVARVHVLVTLAEPGWSEAAGVLLRDAFGLSEAEADVAEAIGLGQTTADIAARRNRSIETVRTQVKAILQKTRSRSQADLVRLVTSLAFVARRMPVPAAPVRALTAPPTGVPGRLMLGDGRILTWFIDGPGGKAGTAVFLHGILQGPRPGKALRRRLVERGVRVVSFSRPGFGESTVLPPGTPWLDAVASDMGELLDHLGLGRVLLIGHMAGGLHAYQFAALHPERVAGVVHLSGPAPMYEARQFRMMNGMQRIAGLTARFTPTAVHFLSRAYVAQFDRYGFDNYIERLYRNARTDARAAADPDIREELRAGLTHLVAQGHRMLGTELIALVQDFRYLVNAVTAPVRYIHGRDDPAVLAALVEDYVPTRPNLSCSVLPDAGQLLMQTHPDAAADAVMAMLAG